MLTLREFWQISISDPWSAAFWFMAGFLAMCYLCA